MSSTPPDIAALPKLVANVAPDALPHTLIVHDPDQRVSETTTDAETATDALRYTRVLPPPSADASTSAALHVTRASRIGCGHHANVYRATISIGADTLSVVAKISVPRPAALEFLAHEAGVYTALCSSEPYAPPLVLPRFYGYYTSASGNPIMLLEESGVPIDPSSLSSPQKDAILALFGRLQAAGYLQKSVFRKNVLLDADGGVRVIDLGRAVCRSDIDDAEEWERETAEEMRDVRKLLKMPVPRRQKIPEADE